MSDPAFPQLPKEYHQTHDNGTHQVSYQDVNGRFWIEYHYPDGTYKLMTTDSGDPNDLTEWRDAEPEDGEPISRSQIAHQDSRPLEETTPLFGPGDQTPDPPDDPTHLPGHWDPVGLRWVPAEPTSSVGKVADDDAPWYTSYKPRPDKLPPEGEVLADPTVSDAAKVADDDAPGDQTPEGQPTTRRSAGLLDDGNAGDTQIPGGGGGAGGSAEGEGGPPPPVEPPSPTDPGDREGYWDPAALRWVPAEPTSSVGRVLGDESTQVPVDEGGGAGGGVDPSGPLDQASPDRLGSQIEQPTQEPPPEEPPLPEPGDEGEGTAAAPFSVDSTSFEGSPARDFDPSVPLDRADPNLQSLDPSLFDLTAPGPTLDPGLFDEAEPGPTLDPRLFDSNAPGPTLDPALFDLNSPGPTVDPALFDERSPGPTLDPALLDHEAPGPTLDPNRLDPSAPGDTLDEAQLERASERPNSVEEPADVKGRGDTDPRAMEEPAHQEPSTTPRHDDHDDPLDVG